MKEIKYRAVIKWLEKTADELKKEDKNVFAKTYTARLMK